MPQRRSARGRARCRALLPGARWDRGRRWRWVRGAGRGDGPPPGHGFPRRTPSAAWRPPLRETGTGRDSQTAAASW